MASDAAPASTPAVPSMKLSSGQMMPQVAFGLYLVPRAETRATVRAALDAGYRHFDSASFYDNEAEAGAELRCWLAQGHERSELFLTTKVWTTDLNDPALALLSAETSIEELGLGYVDMLMVHWPVPDKHAAAYAALEPLVASGKAKALGVSNYSPEDHEELMRTASVPPVLNTFEVNPLLYRNEMIEYFQKTGVIVQAYKPMQRGGATLSADPVVAAGVRVGRTPGQVCLRWALQKNLAVITKSVRPERIRENLAIFDFELNAEEVAAIDALTTEEAVATAVGHYEKRRSGTPAPWGEGPRPKRRVIEEATAAAAEAA